MVTNSSSAKTPQNNPSKKPKLWKDVAVVKDHLPKCDHFFKLVPGGAECEKCGTGLIGVYQLDEGKPVI